MKRQLFVLSCLVLIAVMGSAALAAETVTLRLATGAEAELAVWRLVLDAFEKEYPHIKVELTRSINVDDLIVQAISGAAPDVVGLHEIQIMELLESGLLMNLDPYVAQEPEFLDDFHPIALLVARNRQGVLYGLPTAFSSLVWFYDKQLFDEAGIAYPDGSWWWDPATGGEFVDIARRLTRDRTGDGHIDQWGMALPSTWSRYLPFIVQNGGYYWNEEQTRSTIAEPEFVEAIDFIASLIYDYQVTPRPGTPNVGTFGSGGVAMYYSGRWEVPILRQNAVNPWDVAVPPAGKAGRAATVGAGYTSVMASTQHPEEAWLLLRFLASETSYRIRDTEGQTVPPMRSLASSGFFLDSTPPDNNNAFLEVLDYGVTIPLHPLWPRINSVVHGRILAVFRGEIGARVAMQEISGQVDAILRQN